MAKIIPIETALGRLDGRDCIWLDYISSNDGGVTLQLDGCIVGDLCSIRRPGKLIPYTLRFCGIAALKMTPEDSPNDNFESSFDEVFDSDWFSSLDLGRANCERHFLLRTYDYIFEVLCGTYEFEIDDLPRDRPES